MSRDEEIARLNSEAFRSNSSRSLVAGTQQRSRKNRAIVEQAIREFKNERQSREDLALEIKIRKVETANLSNGDEYCVKQTMTNEEIGLVLDLDADEVRKISERAMRKLRKGIRDNDSTYNVLRDLLDELEAEIVDMTF